jgi:hypothetical protein
MTTTFKNLLLIDYQLDNIHNINQIKLSETDITVIIDDFRNVNDDIFKNDYHKIGLLFSDNILFNKNDLFQYFEINFSNSIVEYVNNINYINYLDINFDYGNTSFTFNYKEACMISLKTLTIYGGIFYLGFINDISCFINNDNGNIDITSDKLGSFILTINYRIFNFNINKILNIVINPIIKYEKTYDLLCNTLYISNIPTILPNNLNGKFYLDDNSLITIDEYSGKFNVKKIDKGIYNQNIYYKYNDLIVETAIKLNIMNVIQYSYSYYEVKYGDYFETEIPIINNDKYKNGLFLLDDTINNLININKTNGILSINDKLETGINNLLIKYIVNNETFEIKISISIIPNIYYNIPKLTENELNIISEPTINSDTSLLFELADNNNYTTKYVLPLIDKSSGKITLKNYEAGELLIYIKVIYKDNFYIYKLFTQIEPYINFENDLFLNYGENKTLIFNYFKNLGNIDIENKVLTDNTYNITDYNEPNYYSLLLEYTKNLITIKKSINFTICPNISYDISNNIFYNENLKINIPMISHKDGIFILNKSNREIVLNEDGSIIISNPIVNTYLIDYIYKYNNQNFIKSLQFNIIPFVEYKQDYEFIYDSEYFIEKPNYYPINGKFTINKQTNIKNININNDGYIKIDNLLVGSYFIFVNYTLNNQYVEIPINFLIKPKIEYEKSYIIDRKNLQNIKPVNISPLNGTFKIKNYNELFSINNIGEIEVNNSINLGLYDIEIKYQIKNITTTINILIIVSPEVEFYDQLINIEYGNQYVSNAPKIFDKDGLFKFENNYNKNIIINENNGIIEISDKIEPNIYNLNVIYQVNESFKKIPININIKPKLLYTDVNNFNITFGVNTKSSKPIVYLEGGHFSLEYNKDIIIDNFTGIINFTNNLILGNHNLLVKYIFNNANTEFNYNVNVVPQLEYEEKNYFFCINDKILVKPLKINPPNGTFTCDNDNFTINKNGHINNKTKSYGIFILTINYVNITNISKELKIIVKPEISYNNIILNYKENLIIKPNQCINNQNQCINNQNQCINNQNQCINNQNQGLFSFMNLDDKNYFKINEDSGEITNTNLLPVDNYLLNIRYELDEILLETSFNITILPIIDIKDSYNIISNNCETNIIPDPYGGIFTIDDQNIIIDPKNGNLLIDNNLEIGTHLLNINYTCNNVKTSKSINIIKDIYLFYEKDVTIIKGFDHIFEPIINSNNGEFKTTDNIKGLILDPKTGFININKDISIGYKTLKIEYNINNNIASFEFNINVLAPFNYKLYSYELNYGDNITIEPSIISKSSNFVLVNSEIGIVIDENNGNIIINGLDVGMYTFDINCFSNNELLNTSLKITIKPIIKYYESLINIKHGGSFSSKIPDIKPSYGIFYTDSNIINLNESGSFDVVSELDVNIYYFDIIYELNNIKTVNTIKLIVNPIFEYKYNQISFEENNEYYIEMPNYYPKNGRFILVNPPKGITIDNNGIIFLKNILLVGSYDLSILYKVNNINLTNTINVKIMPKFYYDTILLDSYNKSFIYFYKERNISIESFNSILEYNNILYTEKPIYNNKGYFDINNSPNNININGDNGIISFKNFDIGNYSLNIKYNVLGIFKIYNYQILIIPSINYNTENIFYKKYNSAFISDIPIVNHEGGNFYFTETYNYFDIDFNTGKITINNSIPIDEYEIVVFYEVNDLLSYKNIKIVVYPDTIIENKEIIFNTDIDLEVLNYYDGTVLEIYDYNLNIHIPFEIFNNMLKIKLKEIGSYNYRVNGIYNDIMFSFEFNLKLVSKIIYLNEIYLLPFGKIFVSDKPILSYYDSNGIFEIKNKIKGITIDRENGEIYVFDKLQVNKYDLTVNYILNDVISSIDLTIVINPILEYTRLYNEILYGEIFNSEIPKFLPNNGKFSIDNDNFVIDNNGTISNKKLHLPHVDNYKINIKYTVKTISTSIDIIIIIKPIIEYNNTYTLIYNKSSIITPHKLFPLNGIIKSNSFPNNILLDASNGNITILNECEPNNYLINLSYTINDIETFTSFNLIIDLFSCCNLDCKKLHNVNDPIILHDLNLNLPIKYKINNQISNNNFTIKNNQIEIKDLAVGIQNLKINYQINKISKELSYRIFTIPTLIYDNEINLTYGEKTVTNPISFSPINGIFSIDNDNFTINKNGIINIKNDFIGTNELNVEYCFNKFKNNQKIIVTVKPYLNYKDIINEGLYNEDLLINLPDFKPKNLNFSIELENNSISDKISIDKIGKIKVDKIPIGNYNLNVTYGSGLNITTQQLYIKIKPFYFYTENKVTLNYSDNKIFVPTTSFHGGTFYKLSNHTGLLLDENNGIIKLNNIIPDKYDLTIYYKYNEIEVNTKLEITILPILKYNNDNLIIKYKTETLTLVPTYLPLGGKFNFSDKKMIDNNIYIDENNGHIIIDEAKVGKYDLEINYNYNNQKVSTNILIEIIPLIIYDTYEMQFYQGIDNIITKPYLNPHGGKFYLKGNANIIKYCKVDVFGKIAISRDIPLGTHEIYIFYDYNKVITSNKFTINIDPYIYYEDVIIYYNSRYTNDPVLLLENNHITNITLLNDKLSITNKGSITMFNNLDVGLHKISIIYNCMEKQYQTYFMCLIKPIILLNTNSSEIDFSPCGGNIVYDSQYLKIVDNKLIFQKRYDKVITNISYQYNNVEENVNIQLESKPIKIYDENIERIYGDIEKIFPLIGFGNFNSKNYPRKVIINKNGEIDIQNLDVGNYTFNVTYTIRNIVFDQTINITIKPKILYNLNSEDINDLQNPILDPPNGDIYIKNNKFKNIKINKNGKLFFQNILPNIYNLTICYKVNNIVSYQDITVKYKPSIILSNEVISINYGDELLIADLKINPSGGIINASIPCILNKNELVFEYINELNIGTHKIDIEYIYNSISLTKTFTLIIKPIIDYLKKDYTISYGENLFINSPTLSHSEGLFNLNIKYNDDNYDFNSDNVKLNNDGSININNLDLGKYIFYIIYQIDSYNITDIIKLTVEPFLNYKQNSIYTIYSKNNKLFSDKPEYYPLGGMFYLDSNNQNININQCTGIIEINNMNIGTYNLNITYKYQRILLKEKIKIIVNPSLTYNNLFITIKYGSIYTIDKPEISHQDGIFSCKNLPKGFAFNTKSGVIVINQKENADSKLYNLIISYSINNLITTTNICVNII